VPSTCIPLVSYVYSLYTRVSHTCITYSSSLAFLLSRMFILFTPVSHILSLSFCFRVSQQARGHRGRSPGAASAQPTFTLVSPSILLLFSFHNRHAGIVGGRQARRLRSLHAPCVEGIVAARKKAKEASGGGALFKLKTVKTCDAIYSGVQSGMKSSFTCDCMHVQCYVSNLQRRAKWYEEQFCFS
jgi:hypothetical protein